MTDRDQFRHRVNEHAADTSGALADLRRALLTLTYSPTEDTAAQNATAALSCIEERLREARILLHELIQRPAPAGFRIGADRIGGQQ